jgi:phthalate 4,5-cis-dihydrodiol dehydrogenase
MSLGLGVVGLGTAGAAMLAAARRRSDVRLVAVADLRADALGLSGLGVRVHPTLEALLADDGVDAVHIATPTPLHLNHVTSVVQAGRHIVVEKPVTADSESAQRLIELAAGSDRVVIVGHSESFEPHVRAAADAIAAGAIGEPRMVIAEKFTDWLRRPRLPEELDPTEGGGLIRRQGVHQIGVVRALCDGDYTVTAAQTRLDPEREVTGSYAAWLTGPGGTSAFVTHDGIGRLSGDAAPPESAGPADERADKHQRSGRLLDRAIGDGPALQLGNDDRGGIVVLGDEGELMVAPGRVEVTSADGRREIDLDGWPSGRDAVLDELRDAVSGRHAAVHDLARGAEDLRLCEEIERMGSAYRPVGMRGDR